MELIRKLISYIPQNNMEDAPLAPVPTPSAGWRIRSTR